MLEIIGAGITLFILLMKEYFSAEARAREQDREFKITQETLRALVNVALNKQIASMAKDSAGAGNAWDQADKKEKP